jgi:hypothetical protein
LVYHEGLSAQEAVNKIIVKMKESWTVFVEAEARLMDSIKYESEDLKKSIGMLVQGCNDMVVGDLDWR